MYEYEKVKPELLTGQGQRLFIAVRDQVNKMLNSAGAARMMEILSNGKYPSGDSWMMLACILKPASVWCGGAIRCVRFTACHRT